MSRTLIVGGGKIPWQVKDWQIAIAADKYRILAPVLLTRSGSPERAKVIRDLAAQPAHQIGGTWMPVAERTLYDWLNAAESDVSGLLPALRSDRGQRRVRISRAWDTCCGLPDDVQDQIAGKLAKVARSAVYNDGASVREALRQAGKELCRLSVEAGSPLKPRKLQDVCNLNSKWAGRIRLNRDRLGYLAKKDHKRFQDQAVGRVKMALNNVPMDLVQGDVHYVDILVQEEGEPVRVRIIAWMDMASMFLWATVVLLSKGKGIIQADVAESLYDLTSCPHGGVPKEFYLDNGGEYSGQVNAFMRAILMQYRTDTSSGADAEDALWRLLAGRPFSPAGRRVLLIVGESQKLAVRVLETIRDLYDLGDDAREGNRNAQAFGCVLVGNPSFMGKGGRQRVASFETLISGSVRSSVYD